MNSIKGKEAQILKFCFLKSFVNYESGTSTTNDAQQCATVFPNRCSDRTCILIKQLVKGNVNIAYHYFTLRTITFSLKTSQDLIFWAHSFSKSPLKNVWGTCNLNLCLDGSDFFKSKIKLLGVPRTEKRLWNPVEHVLQKSFISPMLFARLNEKVNFGSEFSERERKQIITFVKKSHLKFQIWILNIKDN